MSIRRIVRKFLCVCMDHRGATLVDVLMAVGIGSILIAGSTTLLKETIILPTRVQNNMAAMCETQNAASWIDTDGKCAQSMTPTPGQFTLSVGTPLVISYVSWDKTRTTISYWVDSGHQLQRLKVVTNESTGGTISSVQTVVARSISSITANYDYPPGNDIRKILAITVTAQLGSGSLASNTVTRTYQVSPRSF
jgi:hypothetical protein